MKVTNIPDPYCHACGGKGWCEDTRLDLHRSPGGIAGRIKYWCKCLRPVTQEEFNVFVEGTRADWEELYSVKMAVHT